MLETRIATLEEFAQSRTRWNELVGRMESPSIFSTWEWHYTWWEHFGSGLELMILFVYQGAELTAILPLFGYTAVFKNGWLTGKVLAYCSSNDLYPDQVDVVCAKSDARRSLDSISAFLDKGQGQWDVLQLPLVASDSALATWARDNDRFGHDTAQVSIAPFLRLQGNFDDYLAGFDAKQRYNLRSRRKKLAEQHGMRFEPCSLGEEAKCLEILFALHERRAQRKDIVSSFDHARVSPFHRALAERIAPLGWLSLRIIRNDDCVIAASYNFEFAGCAFSYQKGLDPDWEKFGPGAVMVYELINEAFEKGLHEYNFLQGDERYKSQWTHEYRPLVGGNVYNNTWRGQLAKTAFRSRQALKRLVARA